MSIGKVLGGTVIATPAVGGGGYVIYKEVTKEKTEVDTPTEQDVSSKEEPGSTPSKEVTSVSTRTGEVTPVIPVEGSRDPVTGVVGETSPSSVERAGSNPSIPGDGTTALAAGQGSVAPSGIDSGQDLTSVGTSSPGSSGSGDGSSR